MPLAPDPRYPPVSRPAGDFGPYRRRLRPAVPAPLAPDLQKRQPHRWISREGEPGGIAHQGPFRVLVHQARFHIGDALWLTPLLRAIRRRLPDARTTVVAPPAAVPVLAGNPCISEIIPYAEARHAVLERLAGRSFDAALFAFARRPESRWLAKAVDARYRVNLEYFDPALDWRRIPPWLTHEGWFSWGAMPSPLMLLHALDPLLGETRWADEDRRVELHLPAEARRRAAELLAERGIGAEPYAVLAPGGYSSRRWPAVRFARLARRLAAEMELHVLVEGSPAEERLLAAVAAQAGGAGERRIVAAADPLPVFAALLERARLLVANDSAPIHLAEATETPCLYFAQREKLVHSHPAGERCWALYDEVENDLRRITVGQASAAVRALVKEFAKERVSSYPVQVSSD
jgi:ADP-heptose:LPS heptosyltransferase